MRILVTGSLGVIGRPLVKKLREDGHEVTGCDLMHSEGEVGFSQRMSYEDGSYIRCDISEFRQIERVMQCEDYDLVYNCAAEFGRWNGEDYYEQVWKTNVIGLKHLLHLMPSNTFKLIHFSSSEVYGDYPYIMNETVLDNYVIKQMNDYALSKRVNEMQIENSEHRYDITLVRLFNVYGVGETYHPYRSVHSKFCYHALRGLPIDLYSGIRSSTYIDDAINALSNLVTHNKHKIYNIGSGFAHSTEELVDTIWDISGADRSLIKVRGTEKVTSKIKLCDNARAVEDLGYKDTVTLREGIEKTLEWMKCK